MDNTPLVTGIEKLKQSTLLDNCCIFPPALPFMFFLYLNLDLLKTKTLYLFMFPTTDFQPYYMNNLN